MNGPAIGTAIAFPSIGGEDSSITVQGVSKHQPLADGGVFVITDGYGETHLVEMDGDRWIVTTKDKHLPCSISIASTDDYEDKAEALLSVWDAEELLDCEVLIANDKTFGNLLDSIAKGLDATGDDIFFDYAGYPDEPESILRNHMRIGCLQDGSRLAKSILEIIKADPDLSAAVHAKMLEQGIITK